MSTSDTGTSDTGTSEILLVDVHDRVGTLTLNRPTSRNALSSQLLHTLKTAMASLDADPDVDVVILTGADPVFCAGLDLKELGSTGGNLGTGSKIEPKIDRANDAEPTAARPWALTTKPVIGAINGAAITGGFELALCCDFLVASERAVFGDTHTRVGILPGWGLSVLLPQAVGYRRALEMSMTGNFLSANDALHFGLVNHVVPHDELLPFARKLASDVVSNSQPAVRALLASYRAIHRMTVGDGEIHEAIVSRDWAKQTFNPAAVEARRRGIMERGRAQ